MDELVPRRRGGRLRARVPALLLLAAVVATSTACTTQRLQLPPLPSPVVSHSPSPPPSTVRSRAPLCPTAAQVATATGLRFVAAAKTGSTCAFRLAGDARTTIEVRHPATPHAPANRTLSAAREDLAGDPAVKSIAGGGDLAMPAFQVRSRDGGCAAWIYASDGVIAAVEARHPGGAAADTCRLADQAAAVLGSLPAGPSEPTRPVVAVIAPPAVDATGAGRAWMAQVGAAADVEVRAAAGSGSGFLPASLAAPTFSRAAARIDPASSAVVFVSGTADVQAQQLDVARAAGLAFAAATEAAPRARLIVVGPVDAGGSPTPRTYDLRTAIRAAARVAGATWIDPIASGWSAGHVAGGTFSAREASALAVAIGGALRADVVCPAPGAVPPGCAAR